jgi:DNA-binding CsgD family transcriptional regulator
VDEPSDIGHTTYPEPCPRPTLGVVGRHVAEALPGADPGGPLSAREREVAGLVTGGATNREIAARLQIAPRTVSAHVEHILRKLGASRRTEIAVWVATRPR